MNKIVNLLRFLSIIQKYLDCKKQLHRDNIFKIKTLKKNYEIVVAKT